MVSTLGIDVRARDEGDGPRIGAPWLAGKFPVRWVVLTALVPALVLGVEQNAKLCVADLSNGMSKYTVGQDSGNKTSSVTRGDIRFTLNRITSDRAIIDVSVGGKRIISVPDIDANWDGVGNWLPGQTDIGYQFYLSPDQNDLIAVRGLWQNVNIAYVYQRRHGHLALRQIGTERLDDILIDQFAKSLNIRRSKLGTGMRRFEPIKWLKGDRLEYSMFACNWWLGHETPPPGALTCSWYGVVDLRTFRTASIYDIRMPDLYREYLKEKSESPG